MKAKIRRKIIGRITFSTASADISTSESGLGEFPVLRGYQFKGIEEELGGKWDFEADPEMVAKKMNAHIDLKRKALGIDKARDRVLFDMEMRRQMEDAVHAAEH